VPEFLEKYRLVHLYNDFKTFDGAYRFEPMEEKLEEPEII
jgi:hypothetical protein